MNVTDIYNAINGIAPFEGGFAWDNSGLLCGDKNAKVTRVLVVLDADMAAFNKAKGVGADVVVSHHPLIFDPIKNVTDNSPVFHFVRAGISVISAHTCLDAARDGVSENLACTCGLKNIVNYTEDGVDIGRIGDSEEHDPYEFIERIKALLPSCRCDAAVTGKVNRVLCVGGSGGGEVYAAKALGCDTVVTGEAKYNHFIDARNMGINLFAFGHFETENIIVPKVAQKLRALLPAVEVIEFTENSPYERR